MEEEKYMRRCIQLARNGLCNVSPNPMVGAVIICDEQIIGEGYHVRYGEAHAEINAIRSAKDPSLLKRSTMYVSPEPCSHHGRTPPCTDLIIEKQIPKIVIGCQDPFSKVTGKGIQKLRNAGREVIMGVLEKECRELIQKFITLHTPHRPYIVLKWAESADGFIDLKRTEGHPALLSTPLTSMLAHRKRAESDAIMVGTRTALLDDPTLTVRHRYGHNPVHVALNRSHSLPQASHLLDGSVPTLIFTGCHRPGKKNLEYISLDYQTDILLQILATLYQRNLQSLMVEGGKILLESFIYSGIWDEIIIERSDKRLYSGVKAPEISDRISYSEEKHFATTFRHYLKRNT